MKFYLQLIITSASSILGFGFALFLFYLQNRYQDKKNEKALVRNLIFEVKYNIHYLQKCLDQINKCIEKVTEDSTDAFLNIDYNYIGRYHTKRFYNEGLISKYFMPENVRNWNIYLDELGESNHTYITEEIEKWRDGLAIKNKVLKALENEKEAVQYGIDYSEWVLLKLNPHTK